jgi:ABC-2 type transport system ATP-binding protein
VRSGRVVESGTLGELRHLTRTSISAELASPLHGLDGVPGVHDLVAEGNRASFDVDTAQLDAALERLLAVGIRSLTSQPPTLEELFLRHYGDDLDDTSDDKVESRA